MTDRNEHTVELKFCGSGDCTIPLAQEDINEGHCPNCLTSFGDAPPVVGLFTKDGAEKLTGEKYD